MKRSIWWATAGAVLVLAVGAWWVLRPTGTPSAQPGTSTSRTAANGTVNGAASAPAAAIELAPGDVARAEMADLSTQLAITGSLKAVQSAVVKARVAAEVRSLTVREGDRVQAGQRIGQLDDTEFQLRLRQAEDQAAAAKAQLDIAQKTLDNNKALVDQGFISRTALDTSVSNAAAARASMQAARAAADLARKAVGDSEIRAPISGLVSQRLVQPGERVSLDARLVEVVDLSRIELEAAVAPEDVLALRVGQVAQVKIDGLPQDIAAKVVRIAPSAQTGTRAVMAYLELADTTGLRQGLFARASIALQNQQALVVPVSALRFDQAKPYVVTLEQGVARNRPVVTGARGEVRIAATRESAVAITEGLQPGAVVLRGTVGALRDGARLTLAAPAAASAPAAAPAAASAPR